ncbi:M20/M25/M40 family metallo-hydrolase [Iamia majanohamensis]|uniref:M20/M25/M40 family metallo-hydrolase n=1 Tax=Iamia majanohamensis TaxID=467976 RepID=A0AAF0BU28_9ACTN|nr:M20/M25/M40 family metallo-hydrolase [Iamia majanohamensis]WCO65470.1 M20/M25/M40 family metallo-hydrolase [Iamia majanohamensis]
MATALDDPTAEVTDLLQHLIRNRCVNDGSVASGDEARSVETLRSHLDGTGLDVEVYEPQPGRQSLVARIEGRDPSAPTLTLLGHLDVVPVNEEHWQRDPFGGELVDGEVWGRGAVDMLNLTSSMAVAVRRLAARGWQPDGTLVFAAVADEEAAGTWGARHLADHQLDAVRSDYVLTESGGIPMKSPGGLKLPVMVGEKGCYWCRITVRGTAGHGSQPYRTDNALVKAAEVVRRIAEHRPEAQIGEVWRRYLESMDLPEEATAPLLDPDRIDGRLEELPLGAARLFHACTHQTMSPNIVHGGSKVNTIPDEVTLEVDVRTLPGQDQGAVEAVLLEAVGDLRDDVEIEPAVFDPATESPIDSPLWDTLARVAGRFYEGSANVPMLIAGATDARFFRRLGATAYGFGLFSRNLRYEDYGRMFHGDDERVDVESLRLSTEMWEAVALDLLGGS